LGVVKQLLNHIHRHNLCKTSDKILLAVSGGLDSMVMLHILKQAHFTVGVVHCNFQLRGNESLLDETLVQNTCVELGVPCYVKRFNTKAFAEEKGLSMQMAAREVRYAYFYELLEEHQYQYLSTAHHLNDNLETILLNFSRGSGIEGMTGIPVKNGAVIRPLLFATKERLYAYASLHKIEWREDQSNASDDYQRNYVRHQIIPRLKELNPNLENTFSDTLERLAGAHQLVTQSLEKIRQQLITIHNDKFFIDKGKLRFYDYPEVILWELIKGYGFNYDQCKQIINGRQAGKQFLAGIYQLIIDRDHFILQKKQTYTNPEILIEEGNDQVISDHTILNFTIPEMKNFMLSKNTRIAQLDKSKLHFPLCWRSWRPGDSFVPFGMNQRKKISDFLIDEKVSLPAKERITVLESAGDIVWIVGLRVDDRYKVTEHTHTILVIEPRPV
jgi:tRNA(Ile)-lysidine synthase